MSESLTKKLSDGIIDAINIVCQDLPFAKIYRGKIEELLDNNYFTTSVNGKSYDLPVYGDYVFSVGEIVQVVIPLNNFSTAFILPKNGSGGGGASGVQSVNGKTGVVILTKSDFGLGNVENKSAEQILSELTASDIITVLGYTPISNADIPTKLSQLENDENFITNSVNNLTNYYNKTEVDNSLSSKLNDNGDISNTIVTFTEATNRTNINSQEKTSTIFGKIKKWFSDLKTIAFTGAFSDLVSHPTTLDGYGITDGVTETELNTLSGRVDTNEDNIAMAESDIEGLQTDVNTLKTDNTSIKSAVKTLQDTYVPNTRKINNQSLENDVILKTSDIENNSGYITQSEIPSEVLMITVTGSTADKTWEEIEEAYNDGKVIQCRSNGIAYDLAVAVIASKLLYFTSSNGYTTIHRMVYSGGSWSSGLEYLVDVSRTVNGKSLATNITLTANDVGALPNQAASADALGGIKVGAGLSITSDGTLSATGGGVADAVEWNNVLDTPTTLSGYGITDANINNGTINLGQNSITPLIDIPIAGNNIGGVKNGGNVTINSDGTVKAPENYYIATSVTFSDTIGEITLPDSAEIKDGTIVSFVTPAAGLNTTGIKIGEYTLDIVDGRNRSVLGQAGFFAKNCRVSVILDLTNSKAWLQNIAMIHVGDSVVANLGLQTNATANDAFDKISEKLSEKADKTSIPKIFYGNCNTIATDENKVVVCPEFTTDDLVDGTIINVYFQYSNSATAFYLNINNTGADYAAGQTTSVDAPINYWRPQSVVSFIYNVNQERWQISKGNAATTTYYGLTKLSSAIDDTSTTLAATPSAVKQAYDLANTANTTANSNTAVIENKQNKVLYGTDDLTAGTSELADGELYFVYE